MKTTKSTTERSTEPAIHSAILLMNVVNILPAKPFSI